MNAPQHPYSSQPGSALPPPNPQAIGQAMAAVNSVLLGKQDSVRLAMSCLIAGGHLLLEDLPGMGKTVLAQALARTLGLNYKRVQFTNDLLPGDLLGAAMFARERDEFVFHPGPIFTQLLLADEINRASPKTQSALLEAMEEGQVSCDGISRPLPVPFFVIATQNPVDQLSTHHLPEAQLDRFMMRLSLGYPDAEAELAVLRGEDRRSLLAQLPACLDDQQLQSLRQAARAIHASDALLAYVRALAEHTRQHAGLSVGLSPRGALALLAAARAWALLAGRDHVLPADVQAVFAAVVMHRLGLGDARQAASLAAPLLDAVTLP